MKKPSSTINYEGTERKIGLEIEYTGLSLDKAASLVQNLFGGNIFEISSAIVKVTDTVFGDFKLELDAIPLQKIASKTEKLKDKEEESMINDIGVQIGEAACSVGAKIVPLEIVSPPITLNDFPRMEELRQALLSCGAKDTKENIFTAFGLHINPEVSSLNADYIIYHLKSFLLLTPWLRKLHDIDFTRKATSFIDPFPEPYLQLVLDKTYMPNMEKLICDYHKHNPTRNRALDMLPLFAYISEPLTNKLYGKNEKINKRPTFHYRMPNCELANKDWSFNTEWERWLKVEELAENIELIHHLIEQWQIFKESWFPLESNWVREIEKNIQSPK